MSRRRRPGSAGVAAAAAPAAPTAPTLQIPPLSRPITVDPAQLEIPDLPLLMKLQGAAGRPEVEIQALLIEAVPMLDRLVVGGLGGFKIAELPAVVVEVFAKLRDAGNPGN